MRRSLAVVALALASLLSVGSTAAAADTSPRIGGPLLGAGTAVASSVPLPPVTAAAFLVADLDTGAVLAAKDAHSPHAPASTLKVLTALTLLPRIPADTVLVPTYDDAAIDGSKVGLAPGYGYSAAEVFRAMAMVSGNDAASVLAAWSGDPAKTVGWMNAEAARLQARDTVARNASGLDAPGQQS